MQTVVYPLSKIIKWGGGGGGYAKLKAHANKNNLHFPRQSFSFYEMTLIFSI